MRNKLKKAFDKSWASNEIAYRYLGLSDKERDFFLAELEKDTTKPNEALLRAAERYKQATKTTNEAKDV